MAWTRAGFDSPWVHKYRNEVIFGVVFFGRQQRKPLILGHAARFARVREVQKYKAEDFWREDFLEGKCKCNPNSWCACPTRPCAHEITLRYSEAPSLVSSAPIFSNLSSFGNLSAPMRVIANAEFKRPIILSMCTITSTGSGLSPILIAR